MRTTLTLDDDVAGLLQRRSRELGKSFKEVVNSALRKGLIEAEPSQITHNVVTRPKDLGLKSGFDPDRMNQLVDELEVDAYLDREADDPSRR